MRRWLISHQRMLELVIRVQTHSCVGSPAPAAVTGVVVTSCVVSTWSISEHSGGGILYSLLE